MCTLRPHTVLKLALAPVLALLTACANMGRPEGGPRDEVPPVFVRSDPAPGALNVHPSRISVFFDENVQLEDAFNKVVVSPAQITPPQVTAGGHRVTVELRDTLLPNTTYTIDFADAIKDLNEGNVLDGFALDFSTGPDIDTLRISGVVLAAENLEPAQGMLVGVYSNPSDTAITTLPLERIARTNQYGQFTIRNLPDGEYSVYAINDVNRDYHWDRSEDVAFLGYRVRPTVENITVTDTLFASGGEDSLVNRSGLRYLPNDLLLTWFNENYKAQYVQGYGRSTRKTLNIEMGARADSVPRLTIASGAPGIGRPVQEWGVMQVSPHSDSLKVWITDPEVLAADSLRLALSYIGTDSLENPVWKSDTLRFFYKEPKRKKNEIPQRQYSLDSISGDTIWGPDPLQEYVDIRILGSRQELNRPMVLQSSLPWADSLEQKIRLEMEVDSVWTPVPYTLSPDSTATALQRLLRANWTPGMDYRVSIDSAASISVYPDIPNKPFSQRIKTAQLEDYSNLKVELPRTDSLQVVVELLNASDAPVYRAVKPAGTEEITLGFLAPGTYYMRAFTDTNLNGIWDTGSLKDSIQPEDVYYYSRKLNLKKNWDVTQSWDLWELAVDAQKPRAITKNKPKLKRGEQEPVDPEDEAEQEYQDRIDPFTPVNRNRNRGNSPGGLRQNNNAAISRR